MRTQNENKPPFPPAPDPESALYDGFLNDADRAKTARVRSSSSDQLADLHPDFADDRLSPLLLHYKGRHFKLSLTADEAAQYQAYRRARLEQQAPKLLADLKPLYQQDEFLAEELRLYFESLID